MTQEYSQELAIHGGTPAKQNPDPPMYPGGMAIADEEEAGVLEVLRAKRLFRYYGPGETESKASQLERAFAEKKGTPLRGGGNIRNGGAGLRTAGDWHRAGR